MNENAKLHSGKIALVTGAASGIGQAIAEMLSAQGAQVVVVDRSALDTNVFSCPNNIAFNQIDLIRIDDIEQVIESTIADYGGVDILINNAGVQHVSAIDEFPIAKWEDMVRLMVTVPFVLTKCVWNSMKAKRWGRILNMGSIHSLVASENKSAYVSAKHGLLGLTKAIALEGGPIGINANIVCPAYVRTPLFDDQLERRATQLGAESSDIEHDHFLRQAAIKRIIEPDDVASLVSYLVSEAADAITGAAIPIDVGWTSR